MTNPIHGIPRDAARSSHSMSYVKVVALFAISLLASFFAAAVGDGTGLRAVCVAITLSFTLMSLSQCWRAKDEAARVARQVYFACAIIGSLGVYASLRGERLTVIVLLLVVFVCGELIAALALNQHRVHAKSS